MTESQDEIEAQFVEVPVELLYHANSDTLEKLCQMIGQLSDAHAAAIADAKFVILDAADMLSPLPDHPDWIAAQEASND